MNSPHKPEDFPTNRLGLCMIVKDEARALGRCLTSIRDWVSEIVIIDTGSTDETVAIARAHGATIGHFQWCDDFSAARNAALDLATREWVLVLDGDETFHVVNPEAFADALRQAPLDGFNLPISSLNDDGTYSHANVFRLFRRAAPNMRYRGEIHEQLEAVAAGKVRTSSLSCIRLDHDGYTTSVYASKKKGSRNILLSRKLTQSRPNDPFSWFVLAMALTQSDPDGMLQAGQTAFNLLEGSPGQGRGEQYVVSLYLALIGVYRLRNRDDQAMVLADRALGIFPDSPDLRYQRGICRMAIEDYVGAANDFTAALTVTAAKFMLIVDPASVGYGSRTHLAQALLHLNRGDEAIDLLRTAIAESPLTVANAHAELGALLLRRGAFDHAAPFLEEAFDRDPRSGGIAFDLAWCVYRMGNFTRAEEILRGLEVGPKTDYLLARVLLESGKAKHALPLLTTSQLPEAALTLGWTHFVLGHAELANSAWDSWDACTPEEDAKRPSVDMFRLLLGSAPIPTASNELPLESLREMEARLLLLLRYQRTSDVARALQRAPMLGSQVWPALRTHWAQTLALGGHTDLAVPLLIEAANDNSSNAAVYYWLGYCALLCQQDDGARTMFTECLRRDPHHTQASQALALLN